MRLRVRVTPRAARDELAGVRDGVVLVRVTAPPADGRANEAVCRLLARSLGVPPSRVSVVRGHSAREKTLEADVPDEAAARRALETG
ncbi:MAG TPA: DUF167 domain-containing protein [Solirubrobacteraceae bacterium]|nr:DUF167 domain-containing protein [Solirubrobacteraceae bacterium]